MWMYRLRVAGIIGIGLFMIGFGFYTIFVQVPNLPIPTRSIAHVFRNVGIGFIVAGVVVPYICIRIMRSYHSQKD